MEKEFSEFAKSGLEKAKKMGADHAEIFVVKSRSLEVEVKDGKIDEMKQSESNGVGLRVIKNNRLGFSFSSDFRDTAVDKMIHQAIKNSSYNDEDPYLALPEISQSYPKLSLTDPKQGQYTMKEKLDLALAVTEEAKKADSRVARIERSGYEDGSVEVQIANTNGILLREEGSFAGLFCLALGAQNGEQQSGYGMDSAICIGDLSPVRAGQMAGKKAVQLLGATSVKSAVMDLVLEPMIACQIMGIISACFSGEAVLKKKSFLAGKLEKAVANPLVNLIDDGTLPDKLGSSSFDGEGVASQRTVLLENGVLKNYLYDTVNAKKAGTVSTGNGNRGSYKGSVHIGTSNYYMEGGKQTPEALIGSVEYGLYVTEIMGAHTANPVSGDFSFGATGILIEHGQFTRPVRGITIAGNFETLLKQISAVANDLTFYGSSGAPTVRIADISVGGE